MPYLHVRLRDIVRPTPSRIYFTSILDVIANNIQFPSHPYHISPGPSTPRIRNPVVIVVIVVTFPQSKKTKPGTIRQCRAQIFTRPKCFETTTTSIPNFTLKNAPIHHSRTPFYPFHHNLYRESRARVH